MDDYNWVSEQVDNLLREPNGQQLLDALADDTADWDVDVDFDTVDDASQNLTKRRKAVKLMADWKLTASAKGVKP